jgi:TRAP-type C4-dicarboxylate transport system substrate-binding protein
LFIAVLYRPYAASTLASARNAAALLFAKSVENYTQGRYKVQVFCCSQLGNDPKNIEL